MHDDYLWDRSGSADAEVEHFERVLGRLRSRPPLPSWPDGESILPVPRRPPLALVAAAASLLFACASGLWMLHATRPSWPLVRLAGMPTVGTTMVDEGGRLLVGEWLETDARSRASLAVATIGRLDVDPGTRLRLVATSKGHHRLELRRGSFHALIWAPPGQFVVETPSSTAVDLGCEYTLRVDGGGAGLIEVITGWVGFRFDGRESFIPAGAQCMTRPRIGPGTPSFDDASPRLRAALAVIDFAPAGADRGAALDAVLADARPRDAFTMWHLLARVPVEDRDRVFDGLARLVPPPGGVDRDGIRRGDRSMLDAWWTALGLGTSDWWRTWERPWP